MSLIQLELEQEVDCSEDHYNLAVPATEIMKAVNFIKSKIPEGTPIVVLIGEDHSLMLETILPQAVLAAAKKAGMNKMAFGLEQPLFFEDCDEALEGYNKDYRGFYAETYETSKGRFTLSSSHTLFNIKACLDFCVANDIPASANDCAVIHAGGGFRIDWRNAENLEIGKNDKFDPKKLINPKATSSLAFRNHMMVKRAMAHLRDTQAQLYVQQTGFSHLFGADYTETRPGKYEDNFSAFEDSLSYLFSQEGCAVLTVHHMEVAAGFPLEAFSEFHNSIKVHGLAYHERHFMRQTEAEDRALWDRVNKDSSGLLTLKHPS